MTTPREPALDPGAPAFSSGARRQVRARSRHLVAVVIGGQPHNALLLDISITGARVETAAPVAKGDRIGFSSVRMGLRPGEVIWAAQGEVGIRFLDRAAAMAVSRNRARAPHI
ncbi:MAG: PilZ domain-containing protein [Pacificimonas sp.]